MGMHRQDGLSFATLRAAEAVIDTRSLTGAAQKLGISQPAVSMHLGRLEKAIGTPLIKKLGNRIIVKEEISRLIHLHRAAAACRARAAWQDQGKRELAHRRFQAA